MTTPFDPDRDFAFIPPELDEGNEESGFFRISADKALLVKRILMELVARQTDSLGIYDELPAAQPFHRSDAFIRLLRGSNRAGKTLTAAVEFARAVTGQDPYGKYPKTNGLAFIFGLDLKHLGLTVFPKLFQPGAFYIIRDLATQKWRTYRPWLDKAREAEALPAPPLIPPRYIADIAWEEKKTKTPRMVRLVNGWEMYFFSSMATMPQGQSIDLWWGDEELSNEKLVAEANARCAGAQKKGRGMWSATPQAGSLQLYDLHEKAEDNDPHVKEYALLIKDNPYIEQDIKDKLYSSWSEEERRVRWEGEYAYGAVIIYPEFSDGVHAFDPARFGLPDAFQVPYNWTIYSATDPGRQVCATAFWAIPPPRVGNFVLMFDELYIEKCTATLYGERFGQKMRDRCLEALIIDHQAGRTHDVASGLNVERQYQTALVANKVQTRVPGCTFTWGSNDPKAGILAFRELLRIRALDSQPTFYVYLPNCPNFRNEIRRYRWKKLPSGQVLDEAEKRNDHLMDCCRYLAMAQLRYIAPRAVGKKASPAVRALAAKKKKKRDKDNDGEGGHIRLG